MPVIPEPTTSLNGVLFRVGDVEGLIAHLDAGGRVLVMGAQTVGSHRVMGALTQRVPSALKRDMFRITPGELESYDGPVVLEGCRTPPWMDTWPPSGATVGG